MFRETGRGVFSVNKSTIIFYLILTTVTLFRSVPLKVTARGTATQETRVRDLNKEEILSTEITMKEDHRLFASNLIMRPEESFLNEVKPEDNNHVDKKQLKGYVLKSPEYPASENVQNPTRHWAFRECLKNVREWSVRRRNFVPSPPSLPPPNKYLTLFRWIKTHFPGISSSTFHVLLLRLMTHPVWCQEWNCGH